jgi:hypothetical protein
MLIRSVSLEPSKHRWHVLEEGWGERLTDVNDAAEKSVRGMLRLSVQDEDGGSLAGTSTDGVLGAVDMDDDIVGNARVPGDSVGSGDQGPADGSSGQPATVGRRISFAEGLAEAASSGNGGAAKQPASTAEAPQERSSWDGFKP